MLANKRPAMAWLRHRLVAWLWPEIERHVSVKMIRWREAGNMLNHEQRRKLDV